MTALNDSVLFSTPLRLLVCLLPKLMSDANAVSSIGHPKNRELWSSQFEPAADRNTLWSVTNNIRLAMSDSTVSSPLIYRLVWNSRNQISMAASSSVSGVEDASDIFDHFTANTKKSGETIRD